jgi:hypothetical protein
MAIQNIPRCIKCLIRPRHIAGKHYTMCKQCLLPIFRAGSAKGHRRHKRMKEARESFWCQNVPETNQG